MSKWKNPRKRLSENATDSRIAEANDIWHSTAIEDYEGGLGEGGEENLAPPRRGGPPVETPIKGKKAKVITSTSKDSGRGRSSSRGVGDEGEGEDNFVAPPPKARPKPAPPVVINPPSGHTFFSSVLQRCGYIIRQPVSNNEMFKDAIKFRKTLADWLVANEDEMRRIETETSKFLKATDAYLSEKANFILSMKPTRHETELIQPSLLHCLLGIEAMQVQVLKIVFVQLGEASFSSTEENVSIVSSILNQLKWLPTIVEGQKFADSILSILNTASASCQSLIIRFLPDILPSNLHLPVAEKLLEKFSDEGPHLNISLMDCFSSLDIPDGFWSNIRSTAIDQMASASLEDIPAYFSFLFRAETVQAVTEVVEAMREKVTLVPGTRSPKMDAFQVEILEKIGFCITVNPGIVKIWTKQVKDDLAHGFSENICKIDLLMLFVFAEDHKASIPALKLLFAEKQIVLKLFEELMKHNTPMVYQLFTTISKFLDAVLRGRDPKCLETVCEMTVKLFLGLSALEAQTLMGNMSSILVNFPPSRETVLQILTKLAEEEPKKLLLFAPYLMGVLEYVMQFPAGQIRSLMNVLAILAQTEGRNPGESNHFAAEFSILLRKQLTHSDIKIRCFGVYGALASIRRMAEQEIPDDIRIRELLKLAWTFVERDEDACSIFLDELASCVDSLPFDICQTYRDILRQKFEQLWTIDAMEDDRISQFGGRNNLRLEATFDANKELTEERLLINFENQAMSMSPLVIPAHLRALALLESKVESGDLIGIDAILGCPVLFPALQEHFERDTLNDFKYNQRYQLGQYLVLAINFFRESVCAFVEDANVELRVKVWLRLENMLKLQKLLVKHFDQFPALPYAYVAEKTIGSTGSAFGRSDGAGPSSAMRLGKGGKTDKLTKEPAVKKKAKKKARTEVVNSDGGSEDEEVAAAPAGAPKKAKISLDEEIQPKRIHVYLRRLDKSVFNLLRFPLRNGDEENVSFNRILLDLSAVSQNPGSISHVEKFSPEVLALLLMELRRQVQDPRSNLNILRVKKLFKYVITHMHQIQSILLKNEENDMADVTEFQVKLESCLRLLIDVLTGYLDAVNKIQEKDVKQRIIDRVVGTISTQALNRNTDGDEEIVSTQTEVMANVASYLGGFASVIKDSSTALDHMKMLKSFHDLLAGDGDRTELKKAIDNAARVYLRTDWKLPSAKVDGFLKIWLGTTKSPMKVINHLTNKLLWAEDEEGEEESAESGVVFDSSIYKSCSASNFHIWYSAMLGGLSQYVYKNMRRRGDFDDSIKDWREAVEIFKALVSIAQKEVKPKNLKTFILTALLRHCRLFLEAFISGGAELLPQYWKQEKDAAQLFCKALQIPCRILQHICEHSKIQTDLLLLKNVPLVKRVLETLVFRVREVLGAAGAANAFWMGALKHRDLKGACIGSQIVDASSSVMNWSSDEDSGSEGGGEDEDEIMAAPLSGMTDDAAEEVDPMEVDALEESSDDE